MSGGQSEWERVEKRGEREEEERMSEPRSNQANVESNTASGSTFSVNLSSHPLAPLSPPSCGRFKRRQSLSTEPPFDLTPWTPSTHVHTRTSVSLPPDLRPHLHSKVSSCFPSAMLVPWLFSCYRSDSVSGAKWSQVSENQQKAKPKSITDTVVFLWRSTHAHFWTG